MRIFHWAAVLGTGAMLRGASTEQEQAEAWPGAAEEPVVDVRAARARTGPLPRP